MVAGFLPFSRAPFMMDVVALAMLLVLPVLTFSLVQVRKHRHYKRHKLLQLVTGCALLIVVLLFEIDVRLHGWSEAAKPSPYYETWLFPLLYVHLVIAISTTILWIAAIVHALKRFADPPRPGRASHRHRLLGWLAAGGMYATTATGWTFFWAAFVA